MVERFFFLSRINKWLKRELYFAKRDPEFCLMGMAAFILFFPLFIFPADFRSYDWVSHIGVISSSQTCLSAGTDNCAEYEAESEGIEKESGRKIQTDRPVIYSHLLQSFLIDLACLHQQPDPGMAFFSLYLTLQLRPLVCTRGDNLPSVCQSKNLKMESESNTLCIMMSFWSNLKQIAVIHIFFSRHWTPYK